MDRFNSHGVIYSYGTLFKGLTYYNSKQKVCHSDEYKYQTLVLTSTFSALATLVDII